MKTLFHRPKLILLIILIFAFLVRIAAVQYGLPLSLVSDEPPFTISALRMLQLKSLLPGLHPEVFRPILYFPAYLAYIYLIPFAVLLGIYYLFFQIPLSDMSSYVVLHLDHFFLIARVLNVLFGVATIALLYVIAQRIFKSSFTASVTAFFLASSLLHTALSSVGRDWVPATFLFVLSLFVLTSPRLSSRARYIWGSIIAGLAFGISLIAGFIMVLMLLWYIFYERHSFKQIFREYFLYASFMVFLFLVGFSFLIYPYGFHLGNDNSLGAIKSVGGFFQNILVFLKPVAFSEPILALFALLGFYYSFLRKKGFFFVAFFLILGYCAVFYLLYHNEHRFTIYLFPFFTLLAGYGFTELYKTLFSYPTLRVVTFCLLFIPFAASLKLASLEFQNDTRMQARNWIETTIQPGSSILVQARLMRLSATPEAIAEQEQISPGSLREIDRIHGHLPNTAALTRFHALNLYSLQDTSWYTRLSSYAKERGYKYLVFDPYFPTSLMHKKEFSALTEKGTLLRSFGDDPHELYSLTESRFGSLSKFFSLQALGPRIEIYSLAL